MRHHPLPTNRDQLVGRRVVVRYRLHGEAHAATDVLGILESWQEGVLRIRRTGVGGIAHAAGSAAPGDTSDVVLVAEGDVIATKAIPARPVTRRDVRDLESAAARGWQALETGELGGWLLRAAGGFTRRANSCLPLGDPGIPLDAAVTAAQSWYRERGLTPTFQVPDLLGGTLKTALDARGWTRGEDVLVLTAALDDVRSGNRTDLPPVLVEDTPDDAWLARYHYRGDALPAGAIDVLTNADDVGFASVNETGRTVAIARGAVSDASSGRRWLGVTAVEVSPDERRRGLGSHVAAGLAAWAAGLGASDAYLQVEGTNTAAQATYRKLGFGDHHTYHYRQAP